MKIRTSEGSPPPRVDHSIYPTGIDPDVRQHRQGRPWFTGNRKRPGSKDMKLADLAPGTRFQSGGHRATVVGPGTEDGWVEVTEIRRVGVKYGYARDPEDYVEWWAGTDVHRVIQDANTNHSGAA